MRLLRVQIATVSATGFSPEAQDFAILLGRRLDGYDALVLLHDWAADAAHAADRFLEVARAPAVRTDTGWRPNPDGERSWPAKLGSLLRFRRVLDQWELVARRYAPEVIASSQQRWDCAAAAHLADRLRKPHIIDLHYEPGPILQPPRLLRPLLGDPLARLHRCARVLAVSDFVRERTIASGVAAEKVFTLYNTREPVAYPSHSRADVRRELAMPEDARLITMVARLVPEKGQVDALRAFRSAAASRPEWSLVLVGDGPQRQWLRQLVGEMGLNGRVHLLGNRADVARLLAASDVFLHPSRREAFGIALLEAQMAGLPVIAYDEGGTPEVVRHGVTGLLSPPGDLASLAGNLAQLLADRQRAEALGRAGQAWVAHAFDPGRAAAAFTRHLHEVAGGCLATSRSPTPQSNAGATA